MLTITCLFCLKAVTELHFWNMGHTTDVASHPIFFAFVTMGLRASYLFLMIYYVKSKANTQIITMQT